MTGTAAVALSAVAALSPAAPARLEVRANAAFAACLAPALEAFNRTSPVPAVLTVGEPDPPLSADLVVGDDTEMTRLLEGGAADLSSSHDLGYLPWVEVTPAGSAARALSAIPSVRVAVPAGRAAREARASLGGLGPGRLHVAREAAELRDAAYALVPRSLAGRGSQRPSAVRPLVATAAVVVDGRHAAQARSLLGFLRGARPLLAPCLDPAPSARSAVVRAASVFGQAVVDWWIPQCSIDRNRYNDPLQVLGEPDAASLGGRDNFRGMISLGQAGFVVVDMGAEFGDAPGPDIRVFQTTTGEPVTLYASLLESGPFTLIGLRVPCGQRTRDVFSNHCDFDLADSGVPAARYLKIEDGEIYPCLAGGTATEGADIDAVQLLNAGTGGAVPR
jgi:hypothetical protein